MGRAQARVEPRADHAMRSFSWVGGHGVNTINGGRGISDHNDQRTSWGHNTRMWIGPLKDTYLSYFDLPSKAKISSKITLRRYSGISEHWARLRQYTGGWENMPLN